MGTQVQVFLDEKVYNTLLELQSPPDGSINDVLERLLFHEGQKSNELIALEREAKHYSFDEELERTSAGIYSTAGS
jgi:hypothetical protein